MQALLCSLIVAAAALKSSNQNLFQKREHKLTFLGSELDEDKKPETDAKFLLDMMNENKSTDEMMAALGIEPVKEMDTWSKKPHHAVVPKLRLMQNDASHKVDFLKDPNATAVEDMLNLTKEERDELKRAVRIDTPVDVAIQACTEDSHKLGCKDSVSPIHCLAMAVKEKAAEISADCRKKTEKALPYACDVELYTTHCDGVEMPLVQCLDKNHPSLGEECKDTLVVTKKVLKSLKELKTSAAGSAAGFDLDGDSGGYQTYAFGLVLVLIVLVMLWIRFEKADLLKTLQDIVQREMAAIRIPGFEGPIRSSKFDDVDMDDEEPLLLKQHDNVDESL